MRPSPDCTQCPSARASAFACLKAAQRSRLAKATTPHAYQRGQAICYQGTPALAVFCVRSGLVKLTRQLHRGVPSLLAVRTRGDLFGYRAVLARVHYGISAEAVEPSVVCTIPREDFLALLDESHELALHLLERIAIEYRCTEEQLVERAGESVERRTARFLAKLAEPATAGTGEHAGVLAPTRREDLALLLGTTPETLSRTLHGLARRGLVRVGRKEIQVLDPERLRSLSE